MVDTNTGLLNNQPHFDYVMAQNKTQTILKIRHIYWTWTKCQRHEPGDLKNAAEMQDYSVYQAAGSAHSAAHKASLHSLPPLELTHLTSSRQSATQRPHTGAPIDGGARTGPRVLTLCQRGKLGPSHSCSPEDPLGKLHLFFFFFYTSDWEGV